MTTPDSGTNCEETLKEIEAFLDGELSITLQEQIQMHLADCSPCMQRAEFRRHVKVVISSKCTGDAVPPSLERRIRSLLDDPPVAP